MNRSLTTFAALAATAMVAVGCGGSSDSTTGSSSRGGSGKARTTLSLVAYSTPQVVYDELIPAFNKTSAGEAVAFKSSYGPSGDQSRAVEGGLKSDVVTFSLAPDMDRLVSDKLVGANWSKTP